MAVQPEGFKHFLLKRNDFLEGDEVDSLVAPLIFCDQILESLDDPLFAEECDSLVERRSDGLLIGGGNKP